jgi:nucleotide-binding universal stress UspA family protein
MQSAFKSAMRILLAVDSSVHSDIALHRLRERPWPERSIVRILSVVQLSSPPEEASFWDSGSTYEHLAQALLFKAREIVDRTASELGALDVEKAVRRGDPRAEIVNEAKDWNADLIVVGSHGRTGVRRWVLGSVAEHVVRYAHCSVEVCR